MLSQTSQNSKNNPEGLSQSSSKKRTAKQANLSSFFNKAAYVPAKRAKVVEELPPAAQAATKKQDAPIESKTSVKETNLQNLLQYSVPMSSKAKYIELFDKIADAYLNHTVLEVRPSGSESTVASKYFRVSEIEFYLNDYIDHKDTFTHGDPM